jgi:hypothetical protein
MNGSKSSMKNVTAKESRLAGAVLSLSLPGPEALARVPEGPNRVDRLALLFDEEYTEFMERLVDLPNESQIVSLQNIDRALNAIAGADNRSLWTNESLESDPHWNEIRQLAKIALRAFDWPSQ